MSTCICAFHRCVYCKILQYLLASIDVFITVKNGHCTFKTLDRMHVKNVQGAQYYSNKYKACNGYCSYSETVQSEKYPN